MRGEAGGLASVASAATAPARARRSTRGSARPKLAQRIADAIRARVAAGSLRPGEPLPNESELVERFGASRPTVREALRILEAEGLVAVARGPRGGARLRSPDVRAAARHCALLLELEGATVADVLEARLLLEPAAARRAAERAPAAAARALAAVVAAEERAAGRPEDFLRAAIEFQEKLVAVSGNRTLGLLARLLHDLVERQAAGKVPRRRGERERRRLRERVIAAHRGLVAAIRAGRGALAEARWRAFLSEMAAELSGAAAAEPIRRHGGTEEP